MLDPWKLFVSQPHILRNDTDIVMADGAFKQSLFRKSNALQFAHLPGHAAAMAFSVSLSHIHSIALFYDLFHPRLARSWPLQAQWIHSQQLPASPA
jgi:hypothetical protein